MDLQRQREGEEMRKRRKKERRMKGKVRRKLQVMRNSEGAHRGGKK